MAKPKEKTNLRRNIRKKRIAEKLRYEKIKDDPQRFSAENFLTTYTRRKV